jgi:hypothetical protein
MNIQKFKLFKESLNKIQDDIDHIFLSSFEDLFPTEDKDRAHLDIEEYHNKNTFRIDKWPGIDTYQIIVESWDGIPIKDFDKRVPGFKKRIEKLGYSVIIQYTDPGNSIFTSEKPRKTLHKASMIISKPKSKRIMENVDMQSLIENAFLQSYSGMLYGKDGKDVTNNYEITRYSDGFMIVIFSSSGLDINEFNKAMKSLSKKLDNLGFVMNAEHFNISNETKAFQTQITIRKEP